MRVESFPCATRLASPKARARARERETVHVNVCCCSSCSSGDQLDDDYCHGRRRQSERQSIRCQPYVPVYLVEMRTCDAQMVTPRRPVEQHQLTR